MRYCILALLLFGVVAWRAGDTDVGAQEAAATDGDEQQDGPVRHVVWFKYNEGTSDEDLKKIVDAFSELPQKIEGIRSFEWGENSSPEGLSKGFKHCFLVTFDNAKRRDVYLDHEAHQEFVSILQPHLEEPMVIDYVPQGRWRREGGRRGAR